VSLLFLFEYLVLGSNWYLRRTLYVVELFVTEK